MKKIKRICSLIFGFIVAIPMKIFAYNMTNIIGKPTSTIECTPDYGVERPGLANKFDIMILIMKILGVALVPLILLEGYIVYKNKNEESPEMQEMVKIKKTNIVILMLGSFICICLSIFLDAEFYYTAYGTLERNMSKLLFGTVTVLVVIGAYVIYFQKNKEFLKIINEIFWRNIICTYYIFCCCIDFIWLFYYEYVKLNNLSLQLKKK